MDQQDVVPDPVVAPATAGRHDPARLDGALLCVVGARRSGTHWVQRVISSHPDVTAVPGETYLFSRGIAPLLQDRHQHGSLASPLLGRVFSEPGVVRGHLRALAADLLLPYLDADPGGATVLCERTPEHVEHLTAIAELFPGTRFVHVLRDGAEVVRSLLAQSWGPTHAAEAAAEWRRSVEAGRAQAARVDHYVEVRHEVLRANPAGGVRALFEALRLEVSDDIVADVVREAAVVGNTPRQSQRRSLSRRDQRALQREAGPTLRELGYPVPSRGPAARVPTSAPPPPPRTRPVHSIHQAQAAADQVLAALRGAAASSTLEDLVTEDVELQVVVGGRTRRWRGRDRVSDLLEAVEEVAPLRTPQAWAAQHATTAQYTVVVRGADTTPCTVVLGLSTDGVRELAVYA